MAGSRFSYWRPYIPVAARRAQAAREAAKLAKKGHKVEPVEIDGRAIARTFWGKSWCDNLERYSDFENRLPRGRTYVRNGSVVDLQITQGCVKAIVSGSEIYKVEVKFGAAAKTRWQSVKRACSGKIDSVVELLQGQFSQGVMEILTAEESGLFPAPAEIQMDCSCPDWADMCKHVAAVLYGVGARLDTRPELLFVLRDVNHSELICEAAARGLVAGATAASGAMGEEEIANVFGIELDAGEAAAPAPARGHSKPARRPPQPVREMRRIKPRKSQRARAARVDVIEARLQALREHFLEEDKLTNARYRAIFSVPAQTADKELNRLADRSYLIQRARKRGMHYVAGVELF